MLRTVATLLGLMSVRAILDINWVLMAGHVMVSQVAHESHNQIMNGYIFSSITEQA